MLYHTTLYLISGTDLAGGKLLLLLVKFLQHSMPYTLNLSRKTWVRRHIYLPLSCFACRRGWNYRLCRQLKLSAQSHRLRSYRCASNMQPVPVSSGSDAVTRPSLVTERLPDRLSPGPESRRFSWPVEAMNRRAALQCGGDSEGRWETVEQTDSAIEPGVVAMGPLKCCEKVWLLGL